MSKITLDEGRQMIVNYNEISGLMLQPVYPVDMMTRCETFDRADFDEILAQPTCTQVRIYLGMDEANNIRAIIVGVDKNNMDILPAGSELIIERGTRCPNNCPPASRLNS
jgi:hypothetical protein